MKKIITIATAITSMLTLTLTALAYSGDLSINQQNIRFSSSSFMEGSPVRIYATTTNHSDKDLLGVVRFFDNDAQIGGDQAISLFAGKTDDVFVDWVPYYGSHKIAVKIYPWEPDIDDPNNNWVVTEVFAIQDTDYDGIPNETDDDDDGDGVSDEEDAYPLNKNEQYDTDGDGVGNTKDTDDDNDGLTDGEEENLKTDPLNPDTDDDGSNDKDDKFPTDQEEWLDTDNDKIGNNKDTDDDNDGIPDTKDEFPINKGPVIKLSQEDFTIGLLEEHIFDASPSYDEDGEIVTYLWEIDGKEKEGNSITHMFKNLGDYKLKLTLIDDAGESRTAEFQVNVINTRFYRQIILSILAIILALIIFFKYIAEAKNPEKSKKADK